MKTLPAAITTLTLASQKNVEDLVKVEEILLGLRLFNLAV
jgi:hypothetical protein